MVGIMSLLDTLLGVTLQEIVKQANLAHEVEAALLGHSGILGKLLLLVQKMEQGKVDTATALLAETGLSLDDLMQSQLEAMCWTNALKTEATA